MGKQQATPPPAVDYGAQANAQGQANIDASRVGAQLNRVNQYTPYGSQVYTPGSTPDSWESTITLSPEQQKLLNSQTSGEQTLADTANNGLGRVQDAFSQPFDTSGAPARVGSVGTPSYDLYNGSTSLPNSTVNTPGYNIQLPGYQQSTGNPNVPNSTVNTSGVPAAQTADYLKSLDFSSLQNVPGANDFGAQKQEVEDALYREGSAKLDPQYAAQEEAMRARLANSGVTPGSDAYTQEMNAFNQQRSSDYGDLRDRSILAGGQEQSRLNSDSLASRAQMLSQIVSGGQFQNTSADQINQNGLNTRNQALNEIYNKAGFENTTANQNLQNQQSQAGFNNATAQQGLSDAETSRAQQMDELYKQAGFENDASQSNIQNQLAALGFNNGTQGQSLADAISAGNFQNQQRGASLDESAYLRSLPLNEYNALISGAQVTNPSFGNTGSAASPAPAPVFAAGQAQNQSAMDLYNQQTAQGNSNTQAGVGLVGALASAAAVF